MRAYLETGVGHHAGIITESETKEETDRLLELWLDLARCAAFERLPDNRVRLTVAPTREETFDDEVGFFDVEVPR